MTSQAPGPHQMQHGNGQHFSFPGTALEQMHGTQSQQNMIRQFEAHRMDASAVTSPHSKNRRTSWICPICTLNNSMAVNRCEACGAARTINPSTGPSGPGNYGQFGNVNAMNPGFGAVNGVNAQNGYGQSAWSQQPSASQWQHSAQNGSGMAVGNAMGFGAQPYQGPQGGFPGNGMMDGQNGGKIKKVATVKEFQNSASDIACYNDNPSQVFSTLRSVAKKLLKVCGLRKVGAVCEVQENVAISCCKMLEF